MLTLSVEERSETPKSRWLPFWLLVFFVVCAAYFGYQQLFSTFASYDDEGYVMMSLSNYLAGIPLYDETYSQYGPAYFQTQKLLHEVGEFDVTHDFTRHKTLAFWILISLLSGVVVSRISESLLFGVVSFGVVFPHLDRLCLEPGHPQELSALIVVAVIAIATLFPHRTLGSNAPKRHTTIAFTGALIAFTLLIKINVGLLLGLGVALSMLLNTKSSLFRWILLTVVWLITLGLLLGMASRTNFELVPSGLPLVIGIGLLSATVVAMGDSVAPPLSISHTLFAWVGFGLTFLGIVSIALLQNTSLPGLMDGIFLQHLAFSDHFFRPTPIHPMGYVVGIIGMAMAIMATKRVPSITTVARFTISMLLFLSAVASLRDSFSVPVTGFDERGMAGSLISFATGFCWIVLIPGSRRHLGQSGPGFARTTLCIIAILQPAISFPTPGTQMAVGSFPILIVSLVSFADLLRGSLVSHTRGEEASRGLVPVGILCLIILSTLLIRDVQLGINRSRMIYLDLPGAEKIKLPENQVAAIHSVVDTLNDKADTFLFAENTRCSFYFWTRKPAPTAINATAWPFMLRSSQQQKIVEAAKRFDKIVVVRDRVEWPLPKQNAPLTAWIESNFEFQSIQGPFEIWLPKESLVGNLMPEDIRPAQTLKP